MVNFRSPCLQLQGLSIAEKKKKSIRIFRCVSQAPKDLRRRYNGSEDSQEERKNLEDSDFSLQGLSIAEKKKNIDSDFSLQGLSKAKKKGKISPRLATMAPTKQTKTKEMFKLYDAADVPAIMPFPELALVAATKGQETAVPKLNDHQRSWIHDVALRSVDLPSLKGKACTEFYDRVKTDAFNAKAFQHTPRDEDVAEEARVPALVAAWKRNQSKKNGNRKSDKNNADDASDQEEDEAGRSGLLRGYSIAGWRRAIQKVISNKRTAENSKLKHKNDDNREAEVPAMAKLLGLATYTGRDKFRDDHRDLILEHAKTLPGTINTGSKFRKAEGMLWAQEDQAAWDIAAATEEGVDWKERQTLVASGFKTMVDKLHASGKFCPFVATMLMGWVDKEGKLQLEWVEAVPDGVRVPRSFEKQYAQLVDDNLNAMYGWAEKPLKARDSAKNAPVFPLSTEALDDVSPKMLAQTVAGFLMESYEAAFGSPEIPWAAVASHPDKYYDTIKYQLAFASSGLADLTRTQWDALAITLASGAGGGTCGFFRKLCAAAGEEEEDARGAEEAADARQKWEAEEARQKGEEDTRLKREAEEARRMVEVEEARQMVEAEKARQTVEVEEARQMVEAEQARQREEEEQVRRSGEGEQGEGGPAPATKKRGIKRKANPQLVPEEVREEGMARRTGRTRQTPEEAKLERQKKLVATSGAGKVKPR
ncbi:hypothetical protein B0H19DRAFT_1085790 [Mycena capillaripes]|nr:hypothetical protein B0H19DRAFT_1085790 [Mycena capillaripes]